MAGKLTKTKVKWLDKLIEYSSFRYLLPKKKCFEDTDFSIVPYFEKVECVCPKYLKKVLKKNKQCADIVRHYFLQAKPFLVCIEDPYTLTQSKIGVYSMQELRNVTELEFKCRDMAQEDFNKFADISRKATILHEMQTYSRDMLSKIKDSDLLSEWRKKHKDSLEKK